MEDVHTLVIASYLFGKSCMTLLWIRWLYAFLSSISRLSLSLRDGYDRGAEDSGDTTSLRAVAMASVLRAFLHGICNFRFQQVEIIVLCLERHCS
jgi:hypothetical protein